MGNVVEFNNLIPKKETCRRFENEARTSPRTIGVDKGPSDDIIDNSNKLIAVLAFER